MTNITKADLAVKGQVMLTSNHVTEVEAHLFVCDASDLYDVAPAFRTGWPERVETNLGNGQPLIRTAKQVDPEGEIINVRYDQLFGCVKVRIYND